MSVASLGPQEASIRNPLETQHRHQFVANALRSGPPSPLDRLSYDMHELCNSTLRLPQPISQQTISEWREMVYGRVRQNEELRETLEHERKELQELRAQNMLLKSELSCLSR